MKNDFVKPSCCSFADQGAEKLGADALTAMAASNING